MGHVRGQGSPPPRAEHPSGGWLYGTVKMWGWDEKWPPKGTAVTTCAANEGVGESKGTWTRVSPFGGERGHYVRRQPGASTMAQRQLERLVASFPPGLFVFIAVKYR